MITKIIFILIANILFLYFFWRRLKEDYSADAVFTTAFYVILAAIISQVVSAHFFPAWWFWVGLVASLISLFMGIKRFNLRAVETIEAFLVSGLLVMVVVFLYYALAGWSWPVGVSLVFLTALLVGFFVIDKHYKRISWYRSGRIGFAGFTVVGIFFLVRALVATQFTNMISFSGKYDVFLSGLSAFVVFLEIYNLARLKT